jgi:hypothetical protein
MGREIKTISLDKTTAQIAENIANFSQWVRQQLLLHHLLETGEPIHMVRQKIHRQYKVAIPTHRDSFGRPVIESYNTNRCNPYHTDGRCSVCWPDHLSIEEHTLEIARLYQMGIKDPYAEGEEE